MQEMDSLDTRQCDAYAPLSEEEKRMLKDYIPYWRGKSLKDQIERMIPDKLKKYDHTMVSSMGFSENGHYFAHVAIDYTKLLSIGLKGMTQLVKKEQDSLGSGAYEELHKGHMLEAILDCYDGVRTLSERYAALAEEMAKKEQDAIRADELVEIARICRKVPYEPADTFYEALQSCWMIYICLMLEGWGAGMSLGRADQYLYPYYKRDIERGILTQEKAKELLSLLFIKMNGVINPQDQIVATMMSGSPTMQGITIGGCTPDGADAVNELTYLILDAEEGVGLTNEDIVVRIHPDNPKQYVVRACEVARNLGGKLKFVSDTTTIAALESTGISHEYANNYISTGCHNPTIPAVTHDIGGSSMNYALVLELLLNHGICRATNEQYGVDLGDPSQYQTYEELEEAFEKQFEYVMTKLFYFKHADLSLYEQLPCPLLSSFYDGCIEKGLDINENGVYLTTHSTGISGVPNVADSLAAIKQTIYDDQTLTWERLLTLLENDLQGDEEAYYYLKRAPKFGNNDPYVDDIARRVLARSCDFVSEHTSYRGVRSTPACLTMTINIPFGHITGALPDGRRAGMPLSEGGISPYQGRNVSGISSTLASIAHIDHTKLSHGSILNIRLSKKSVASEDGLSKFADLLRTFCETGGDLVQFNFIDEEVLRDAQEHPENYKDLLVRVATYSAYFVELSRELQDDIISRFEFDHVG
jgi:formate C-acetyltransferase